MANKVFATMLCCFFVVAIFKREVLYLKFNEAEILLKIPAKLNRGKEIFHFHRLVKKFKKNYLILVILRQLTRNRIKCPNPP